MVLCEHHGALWKSHGCMEVSAWALRSRAPRRWAPVTQERSECCDAHFRVRVVVCGTKVLGRRVGTGRYGSILCLNLDGFWGLFKPNFMVSLKRSLFGCGPQGRRSVKCLALKEEEIEFFIGSSIGYRVPSKTTLIISQVLYLLHNKL